jgi:hypothetical protein
MRVAGWRERALPKNIKKCSLMAATRAVLESVNKMRQARQTISCLPVDMCLYLLLYKIPRHDHKSDIL